MIDLLSRADFGVALIMFTELDFTKLTLLSNRKRNHQFSILNPQVFMIPRGRKFLTISLCRFQELL